ncbi:hypothetical protein K3495_g15193, partial [Podosphaera aphanis]
MLRQPLPDDLTSYLVEVRHIDAVLRSSNPGYTKEKSNASNHHHSSLPVPNSTAPPNPFAADPMDLSASNLGRNITWTSTDAANHRIPRNEAEKCAKRAYCFENKLCSWCYDPGHRARICAEARWNKVSDQSRDQRLAKSDRVNESHIHNGAMSQILSLSTPHNDHLLLPCIIKTDRIKFQTQAFLDCGATDDFFDLNSAQRHGLPLDPLPRPRQLYLVDGRLAAQITHTTNLNLNIFGHNETITLFLTNLGKYETILGRKWLKKHNPSINWLQDLVCFNSDYCKENCFPAQPRHITIPSCQKKKPIPGLNSPEESANGRPRKIGASAFQTLSKQKDINIFSLSLFEVDKRLEEFGIKPALSPQRKSPNPSLNNLSPIQKMYREIYPQNDSHDNRMQNVSVATDMHLAGSSLEDIQIALQTKEWPDPSQKLPIHYHQHLPVFDHKRADTLPPHRDCDHRIELKPDTTPPYGPLYNMSVEELQ